LQRRLNKKYLWTALPLIIVFALLLDNYQERYIPPDSPVKQTHLIYKSGILHIHTVYSDGSGSLREIALHAKKAHADFLITADHNTWEAYRNNEEGYIDGILLLTGMELSSAAGHLFIIPKDSTVTKMNGELLYKYLKESSENLLVFLAHPYHPRSPISDWNFGNYTGIELISGDCEWRNDSYFELFESLLGAVFFKSYLNILMDHPLRLSRKWDTILKEEKKYIIGSVDAHANIKLTKNFSLKFPSYYSSFTTIKTHVLVEEEFIGDSAHDRPQVLNALEKGRCYVGIDGYCDSRGFSFYVKQNEKIVHMGASTVLDNSTEVAVYLPDTSCTRIKLLRGGTPVKIIENGNLLFHVEEPGIYRVEVFQLRRRFPFHTLSERPWIYSNPIFIYDNRGTNSAIKNHK